VRVCLGGSSSGWVSDRSAGRVWTGWWPAGGVGDTLGRDGRGAGLVRVYLGGSSPVRVSGRSGRVWTGTLPGTTADRVWTGCLSEGGVGDTLGRDGRGTGFVRVCLGGSSPVRVSGRAAGRV